jgi:hypothetical protein
MSVDNAGNTLADARHIPLNTSISDSVSRSDLNDYYKFNLSSRSHFELNLFANSNDSDGVFDVTRVRLLDSRGRTIATSRTTPDSFESAEIDRTLNAGTYYIRISPGERSDQIFYNIFTRALVDAGDTLATAQPITPSPNSVADKIDRRGRDANDYYTFTLDTRSSVGVTFSVATSSGIVSANLLDSQGNVIQSAIPNSSTLYRTLEAGTYYLRFFSPGESNGGSYSFSLFTAPDAGDTIATARTITPNPNPVNLGRIQDVIDPTASDFNDYYTFTLNSSSFVELFTNSQVPFELLNNSGGLIASSPGSTITRELAAGNYYIRFFSPGNDPRFYSAILTAVSGAADDDLLSTAPTITSDFTISDELSEFDLNDFYRVEVGDLRTTRFELRVDAFQSVRLDLLDSSGQIIATPEIFIPNNDRFPDFYTAILNQTLDSGTYYVRITPNREPEELPFFDLSYSLSFTAQPDIGNTLATATKLGSSGFPGDLIDNNDPEDFYRFEVTDRSDVLVTLVAVDVFNDERFPPNSAAPTLGLQVLNDQGDVVFSQDISFFELEQQGVTIDDLIAATNALLDPGTYYLRVFQSIPDSSTRYNLNVVIAPDPGDTLDTATTVNFDTSGNYSITGRLNASISDLNDYYRFELTTAQDFSLNIFPFTTSLNPTAQLLGSTGQLIANSVSVPGSDNEQIDRFLDAGIYYVRIFPDGTDVAGQYSLSLNTTA